MTRFLRFGVVALVLATFAYDTFNPRRPPDTTGQPPRRLLPLEALPDGPLVRKSSRDHARMVLTLEAHERRLARRIPSSLFPNAIVR